MGIEGLRNLLHPAYKDVHISVFQNRTAAVDAMSWLYRGCYSCSYELNRNVPTMDYLYFIHKMISLLKRYFVTPIMVFDGKNLTAKKKTEEARKQLKRENREKAEQSLKEGNEKEARKYYSRALKITKEMIYLTIDILRKLDVECIVAPYEADAQIAYLLKHGYAHFAISEDSDLVVFGCEKIIYKLKDNGECSYLNLEELYNQPKLRKELKDESLRIFLSLPLENKIYCSIFSGCDYLPSIRGVGIRKAIDFFHRFSKMESVVRRLRIEKNFMGKVPTNYESTVSQISLIFKFQRIYEPRERRMTTLNPLPSSGSLPDNIDELIGPVFDDSSNFAAGLLEIKRLVPRGPKSTEVEDFFKKVPTKNNPKTPNKSADVEHKPEPVNTQKIYDQKHVFGLENEGGDSPNYVSEILNDLDLSEFIDKPAPKNELNERVAQEIAFLFELCEEYSKNGTAFVDKEEGKAEEEALDIFYFKETREPPKSPTNLGTRSPMKPITQSPMKPINQPDLPKNPFEISDKDDSHKLDSVAKLKQEITRSPIKGDRTGKRAVSPLKTIEKGCLNVSTDDLKRKTIEGEKTVLKGDRGAAFKESKALLPTQKNMYDISNFFQKKN